MSVLAYNSDSHLFGWYLGWIIGATIITVIVAEVAAILRVARIIGGQAQQAEQGLQVAHDNTYALRDLTRTTTKPTPIATHQKVTSAFAKPGMAPSPLQRLSGSIQVPGH